MNQEEFDQVIERLNAEKIAIDKQYVKKLQESVQTETESILKDIRINKLQADIQKLQDEITSIKEKEVNKEISELLPEDSSE